MDRKDLTVIAIVDVIWRVAEESIVRSYGYEDAYAEFVLNGKKYSEYYKQRWRCYEGYLTEEEKDNIAIELNLSEMDKIVKCAKQREEQLQAQEQFNQFMAQHRERRRQLEREQTPTVLRLP